MSQSKLPCFESLESRRMMSASPATISDDLQAIRDDRTALNSHRAALITTLRTDALALRAAILQRSDDVAPLRQQFLDDRAAGLATIQADRSALVATLLADRQTLLEDRVSINSHRHDATALAADLTKFSNDRITFINDRTAGVNTIIASSTSLRATLINDRHSIVTFLTTDTAAMTTCRQQYSDDLANGETELNDDRTQLIADSQKLDDDLHAES